MASRSPIRGGACPVVVATSTATQPASGLQRRRAASLARFVPGSCPRPCSRTRRNTSGKSGAGKSTGARMRVYEIAREVGLPNKELIAKIRALGLEVNNHMSSLDPDAVARVKRSLERERVENTVTKRLSSTVLRRRTKGQELGAAPSNGGGVASAVEVAPAPPPVAAPPVVRRPPQRP